MENNEPNNNNKVQIGAKVDPAIFRAVAAIAVREDRSMSNMVERLLKQSPLIVDELIAGEIASETAAEVGA